MRVVQKRTPAHGAAPTYCGFALLATVLWWWWVRRRRLRRRQPPVATGWVPLLGHALSYQRDPAAFVTQQCRIVGPCFSIDLAGKRMVVVGSDRAAVQRVACASESVLSARQAVLEIGFAETLGELNVRVGTNAHARVLRQAYGGARLANEVPQLHAALGRAIEARLGGGAGRSSWRVPDLLGLVRFVVLRACIERMLGAAVLAAAGDAFCDAFMAFQDAVEEATAKAAVLPRALALPLVLWPTSRKRAVVSARLAGAIASALGDAAGGAANDTTGGAAGEGIGPWVRALVLEEGRSVGEAAELACGLLFAAHKNPAIGAAQAVLHALEGPPSALASLRAEAAELDASPTLATLSRCDALRRATLETLRLCAHTIGAVRTVVSPQGFELTVGGDAGADAAGGAERTPRTYHLRRGDTVALAHIPTHRDPELWSPNAEGYDPGRVEWKGRPDDLTFTTFSQGIHRCPGEKLAIPMMRCCLAHLLGGRFDTELPPTPLPRVDFERATLAQRAGPVPVRVCRKPSASEHPPPSRLGGAAPGQAPARSPGGAAPGVEVRRITASDGPAARRLFSRGMKETIEPGLRTSLARAAFGSQVRCALMAAAAALSLQVGIRLGAGLYGGIWLACLCLMVIAIYLGVPLLFATRYVRASCAADMADPHLHYSRAGAGFWVAVGEDGGVVGTVGVQPASPTAIDEHGWRWDPGDAELRRMSVDVSHRRRGVSRALLSALLAHCETAGHKRVVLSTSTLQAAAIELYDAFGFQLVHSEPIAPALDPQLRVHYYAYDLAARPAAARRAARRRSRSPAR